MNCAFRYTPGTVDHPVQRASSAAIGAELKLHTEKVRWAVLFDHFFLSNLNPKYSERACSVRPSLKMRARLCIHCTIYAYTPLYTFYSW